MGVCPADQYWYEGRCCARCPVGSFKSQHCTATAPTLCLPCKAEEYMDSLNFMSNCLRCLKCEAGSHLETERPCNKSHNTLCRCREGHFCHSEQEGRCERCRRVRQCGPGEGVTSAATPRSDTRCDPCPAGTFSNVTDAWSPCQNHTVCSLTGRLTLRPGNELTDTSCTDPSADAAEWRWLAGIGVLVFLLLLGVLYVRRRRRGWQDRTRHHGTQQMDQLLQFRMHKVVRETSEEVVERVVDIRRDARCGWDGDPQDIRHLKGLSVDNVLLNGRTPSCYVDVVKGSSRSLPQTLVYENVRLPTLRTSDGGLPARTRPQPGPPEAQSTAEDGLETDHPGTGDGGESRAASDSRARDTLLSDGGPMPLSSTTYDGPPTLTASEIFGQGRRRRDLPPVAVRVSPPTPPPPRRPGAEPSWAGAGPGEEGGPSPGQRGLLPPESNLQPEEDEWTE